MAKIKNRDELETWLKDRAAKLVGDTMKKLLISAFLLSSFGLVCCDNADSKICVDTERLLIGDDSPVQHDPKSGVPQLRMRGPSIEEATTENAATLCIKEWGWKLAKSQGPNEQLAEAVMQTCEPQLQAVLRLPYLTFDDSIEAQAAQAQATLAVWKGKALTRIIQSRAGHCWNKS